MQTTDTILTSGFRLGRLFNVTWWVNCLFPIVCLAFMWSMQDVSLGLVAGAILLFSVLLHELAHLVVSRSLGGDMDEIQLWPLGGLTHPHGRGYFSDHGKVLFAGPMLNLVIAISCMTRLSNQQVTDIVQNLTFQTEDGVPTSMVVIQFMFAINLLLFLVNFIPVIPFDAGVLLRTYLTNRLSEVEGRDLMIRSGLAMSIFGMLLGFVFDIAAVVAVSAFVAVIHTHENLKWIELLTDSNADDEPETAVSDTNLPPQKAWPSEPVEEQPNFGPSLMPMSEFEPPETDDSLTEDQEAVLHEEVLDEILEKLHLEGRDSLTELEVLLLEQLSDRIRRRRRRSSL
ncbi:MAG: site-2 protease family protein [Fuerstiella sp.]